MKAMITIKYPTLIPLLLTAMLLISACGGDSRSGATPADLPPTHTPFPTFAFVEPTKASVFERTPEAETSSEAEIELEPKAVERGRGRYEALECGNCHGENSEGTDGVKGLLDFDLTEDDFVTFMRSGGELGTRHQFSTDRLSNSGSRNLYQYLVSIAASG